MYNKASLYDTFNAKYLTFQEVSESFIPNDEYFQLLGNNHTLIMGPRGCGKTTLLKMLTPAGLNYWEADSASEIKNNIPFTAVYIPSDIQWKSQLAFIERNFSKEKELGEKITDFLISTNIQLALCRTMQSYLRFENSHSSKEKNILEDEISRDLIDVWNLEKPLSPSFDDIEICLQKRVVYINSLVNKLIFKKQIDLVLEQFPNYVFNNFFDLVKIGCIVFEKKLGLGDHHRWALCFDELEISPKFLQIKLLKFLRSVDQKYLFKLTTTPLFNLENNLIEASQDNDFKTIKLWVHDDSGFNKWREFGTNLVTKKLQRRFGRDKIKPEDVFGEYNLDDIIKNELNYKNQFEQGTGEGSSVNLLFKALSKEDDGFKQFLIQRKINFENPFSRNQEEDKSVFLKHKVNVLYRLLYRNRTRKAPAIHYGVPYIYDICDGNPRSIIGLVDDVLSKSEYEFNNRSLMISPNKQSEIILDISKRYFNLIRNHPDSTLTIRSKEFNLANDILKEIGNYIYSKIVKEDFTRSVHTTFTVDSEIDQKIIRLLEHALFIGAIIYLDPLESLSNKGLIGKRFRLSYLLTPLFRIPSRVNSQINLKTILSIKGNGNDQTLLEFN
jgi:energy-coupling factor transporter ATP-binding protein EcfA2